jgi:hypothetical protein
MIWLGKSTVFYLESVFHHLQNFDTFLVKIMCKGGFEDAFFQFGTILKSLHINFSF